jgi:hypothetical protein
LLIASVALADLDAERFDDLPALAAVGWPGPGSCAFSREWRLSREHVAGQARDAHLWFLFERDERMARAQPAQETERASNSADRCPFSGYAPWAPLRPAYRNPTFEWATRLGRPVCSSCPLDPVSHGISTWLYDRQRSWGLVALRSFDPIRAGERTFPFVPDPACALPTSSFPDCFCRAAACERCQVAGRTRAARSRDGVGCVSGIRLVLLTCGPQPG